MGATANPVGIFHKAFFIYWVATACQVSWVLVISIWRQQTVALCSAFFVNEVLTGAVTLSLLCTGCPAQRQQSCGVQSQDLLPGNLGTFIYLFLQQAKIFMLTQN